MNMLKHAYIIVANSLSPVLRTCIAMLDDPNNDIFLLLDKKAKLQSKIKELACEIKCSRIKVCYKLVNWGGVFPDFSSAGVTGMRMFC